MATSVMTRKQLLSQVSYLQKMVRREKAKIGYVPLFGDWFLRIHDTGATLVQPWTLADSTCGETSSAL